MFPDFIPSEVNLLQQHDSITLVQNIKRHPIATPLAGQPIDTAYVQFGNSKPPILLLHGFDSSVLEFRRLIPLLATSHETWAVDLLGFGFSDRPLNLTYNPDTIQKHLYCFWQTLIGCPVILVGASTGGATAIDFTLRYPEAVDKLVLINSVGYSGSFEAGKFLFWPVDSIAVEYWRQRRIQSLFWGSSFGLLDSDSIDAIRCAMLPSFMPGWERAIADFTRSGGYSYISHNVPLVKHSTLILWGERDDMVGTDAAYKFERAITNSKLVWLNSGHVPQWEQPQTVAREILEFIEV